LSRLYNIGKREKGLPTERGKKIVRKKKIPKSQGVISAKKKGKGKTSEKKKRDIFLRYCMKVRVVQMQKKTEKKGKSSSSKKKRRGATPGAKGLKRRKITSKGKGGKNQKQGGGETLKTQKKTPKKRGENIPS